MKRIAAACSAAAAAGLGAAYGIYHLAFFQKPKLKMTTAEEWADGSRFLPQIRENVEFVDSLPCDSVQITADDGTLLSAQYCHEADDAPTAIIMHGYRATAMRDTMGLIVLCKKLGFNLLMPDQRAHGRSGGRSITMGARERYDARAWAYWASVRSCGKSSIFLMGVSMGATTVLLASGLDLPDNVRGIIADCGYSDLSTVFRNLVGKLYHLPTMFVDVFEYVNLLKAGYGFKEASSVRSVSVTEIPLLYICGDCDRYVPKDMALSIFNACKSEKKLLLVPGAGHAASYMCAKDEYEALVREFIGRKN